MSRPTSTHRRIRRAVQAAVTAVHAGHPTAAANAGEQAIWWHQKADALDLIAQHEADSARADATRSDAEIARRLSLGLGATHTAAASRPAVAEHELTAEAEPDDADTEADAAADVDIDGLEVSWR